MCLHETLPHSDCRRKIAGTQHWKIHRNLHTHFTKNIYILLELCTQTNIDRYHRDKKRKEKKQKNINNS